MNYGNVLLWWITSQIFFGTKYITMKMHVNCRQLFWWWSVWNHSSPWLHENTHSSGLVGFVISETNHSPVHITQTVDTPPSICQNQNQNKFMFIFLHSIRPKYCGKGYEMPDFFADKRATVLLDGLEIKFYPILTF